MQSLKKQINIPILGIHKVAALLIILVIGCVGAYIISSSHAANPFASVTASGGSLNNGAASVSCSGAVSTTCVRFGGGKTGVPFIGINGIYGWGPQVSPTYRSAGFVWNRWEAGGAYPGPNNNVDSQLSDGANVLIILPTDLTEAMSWMNKYNSSQYASRIIYEFGNEAYLKNSGYGMSAQAYAQAYEAAYNAKHTAGIPQPLLFMTTGDECWSFTEDQCDNGNELYLEKAMDASKGGVANLKVDGFSTHTYGGANTDTNNHANGINALLYQHQDAVSHGFTNTPWYVTEWGVTLNPSQAASNPNTTDCYYAKSYADQASCLNAAYTQMIAYGDGVSGTWLKGIIYYGTHDDSTGWFGLLTSPNAPSHDYSGEAAGAEMACTSGQPPPPCGSAPTPVTTRPIFDSLKTFLTNH